MNTLLEAIQKHPEAFIDTCTARARTTPSEENKSNHLLISLHISSEDWDRVAHLLKLPYYRKPLEGVVYCLDHYSEIDNTVWHQIVDLFNEGKIV